ncbi:RNA methyltransferase [Rhodococcus sp. D2-41]|uniref:RNA methyltransferase n=1 Tax=Speluncibacter jeojiensis TaxID=2710754 RepID=A0A9X4RG47_9ACTN|nr:RNA methyltransferase [Rhodococcus sp. D2-41]MDG3012117.1 RNA methyltransferase [Rhodococcus sp. D2-41]MDG3013641.1 RNA methyltransferase [Corynebacteriales bacterium D3-21]
MTRPADPLTERTPRVVSAAKLSRAAERRKQRRFLAEGANAVAEALAAGVVRELFYTDTAATRTHELVGSAIGAGVPAAQITDRAAKSLADTVTPPGLVAVCDLVDVPLAQGLGDVPRLVAVPVAVGEPGNAGTIIRIADAMGADAVVLAGESVDPHNGKCVRSTAGSLFHLPVVRERDIDGVLAALRERQVRVVATAADGEVDLDDADDLLAGPTAWLFGNEAHGLDPALAAAADVRVRIPIHGRAESLNLATAAAICLHASARMQRRGT